MFLMLGMCRVNTKFYDLCINFASFLAMLRWADFGLGISNWRCVPTGMRSGSQNKAWHCVSSGLHLIAWYYVTTGVEVHSASSFVLFQLINWLCVPAGTRSGSQGDCFYNKE